MMARWLVGGLVLWLAVFLWVSVPLHAQQWRYTATLADVSVAGTATGVFCTIGSATCANVDAGGGHVQGTSGVCSLTTANIRISWDGTSPTTSLGQVLTPGVWIFSGTDTLKNLRAIQDDSGTGVLSCVVFGN